MTENRSKQLLDVVLKAADDKLAQEIVALEVGHLTPVADYFVITHGKNENKYKPLSMQLKKKYIKEGFEGEKHRRKRQRTLDFNGLK